MAEKSISISTMRPRSMCAACGGTYGSAGYVLTGFATTARIGDGTLSSDLTGVSLRVNLWLCRLCLEAIVKEKSLILQG